MKAANIVIVGIACCVGLCGASAADEREHQWPQWRGPLGTGVAPYADPPVQWNEEQHVRWKAPLPGKGHSTPVVWDNRVFVTTAVAVGEALPPRFSGRPGEHDNLPITHRQQFVVLSLDLDSGRMLWQKTVHEELPHEGGHQTASFASASPAADAEHVIAFFGSYGLYCLNHDGELQWEKQFGKMHSLHGHGEGSSPVLHEDCVIINWDHEEGSFIVVLDKRTGAERWRKPRREVTSWSTPLVVEHEGRAQVVVCGTDRIRGYDLENGEVLWECGGLSSNIVASPVSAGGIVYAGSSYDKKALLAIRLAAAHGDVTDSDAVLWKRIRSTPYVPSPLLYDDDLYFLGHYQNVLTRVHGPSGEDRPGPLRLGMISDVYGSPVAAGGRIYVTDRTGTTAVISHEDHPKLLAVNRLDEGVSASAAIVGPNLLIRGERHLYCLSQESPTP